MNMLIERVIKLECSFMDLKTLYEKCIIEMESKVKEMSQDIKNIFLVSYTLMKNSVGSL
jgi:hypothetical protein